MKKILLILLVLSLIVASPIFAQNVLIAPNSAAFDSKQADPYTCHLTGSNRTIVWQAKVGDILSFCVPGLTPLKSYSYTLKVDSNSSITIDPYCINYVDLTVSGLCSFILPDLAISQLQSKIEHTLILTYNDGQAGTSNPYQFKIVRPTCIVDSITYEVNDVLPASVPGALRNQQGSLTFENQVGKLRNAGFRIEWQRVQFRESSSALDGYWYMLGWCEGK